MVCPWSRRLFSWRNSCSVSWGASTAVGSSKISSPAPRYSAFRISTRCFIPTGRSFTFARGSTGRLYLSAISRVLRIALAWSITTPFTGSLPKIRFSATVREGTSIKCWCTIPIPRPRATVGLAISTFLPSSQISPPSGLSIPNRIFIRVDFPAPFSPIRAWISPFLTERSTSSLATMPLP